MKTAVLRTLLKMKHDYDYIIKVMCSCETEEQLELSYQWGLNVFRIDNYKIPFILRKTRKDTNKQYNRFSHLINSNRDKQELDMIIAKIEKI